MRRLPPAAPARPLAPSLPGLTPTATVLRRALALAALLVAADARGAGAQSSRQRVVADQGSGPYARARRLVYDGNAAGGRTVVDSMLAAATPGTPAYAEALYWRATLAEHAGEAERDYQRLGDDYAFSPRAADALVRLAQLALVRGQPQAARGHLERLLREHRDGATQARGQYWLARAHAEAGDARGACAALDLASAAAAPGSDLARQVSGMRPRVPNCETFLAGRPPAAAPRPVPVTPRADAVGQRADPPRESGRDAVRDVSRDTARPAPSGRVASAAPASDAPPPAAAPIRPTVPVGRQFTVQVAAYDTRRGAEALAARLAAAGLEARVSAQGPNADRPPFRVRVGRYATPAEAAATQRTLRQRRIAGIVTDAEPEGTPR